MSDEPAEYCVIGVRISHMPIPGIPSFRMRCRICGRRIWASAAVILRRKPTAAECIQCAERAGHTVTAVLLDETRAELHGLGYTDEQIDPLMRKMTAGPGGAEGRA